MLRLLGLLKQRGLVPDRKEADWTHPPRSDGSIGGEKDWWVGGPHRSRGGAEQGVGERALRMKERRRRRRVGGVAAAAREGVADGGRHCRQVGGDDLGGQSLTLVVLTQELHLLHTEVVEDIRLKSTFCRQNK